MTPRDDCFCESATFGELLALTELRWLRLTGAHNLILFPLKLNSLHLAFFIIHKNFEYIVFP